MTIIVDAQLSPKLAAWIEEIFSVRAIPVRDIDLRDSSDETIYKKAYELSAVMLTKDIDFLKLQDRLGSPPQVVWIRCGNTSNFRMEEILIQTFPNTLKLLQSGERFVEIKDISIKI